VPHIITVPSATVVGRTVDATIGGAAGRVTLLSERALRIEPDDVCTIISATTVDNQTTIYAIGRRRQRGHRVTTNWR
jgi:hypothetical protein